MCLLARELILKLNSHNQNLSRDHYHDVNMHKYRYNNNLGYLKCVRFYVYVYKTFGI